MTSKEAVLELICEAKSVNIDERRVCFLRKIIEKDLDILEEYRKIEEELGIDLLTLFKALKNGIYLKFGSEKNIGVYYEHTAILPHHFDKDYKGYFIDLQLELSINFNFYFKDYGKTWALTKEELEEDFKERD